MKISGLQVLRRTVIDLATVLSVIVAGTTIFRLCSFGGPLDIASRYEHLILAFGVTAIAICRAYLEHLWRIPLRLGSRIALWMLIVVIAYLIMCWIDTYVNPYDTFINVFAFGLLIFLVPTLVISTAVYAVVSGSIGGSA